jgi:PAS domain S-box-containing protein
VKEGTSSGALRVEAPWPRAFRREGLARRLLPFAVAALVSLSLLLLTGPERKPILFVEAVGYVAALGALAFALPWQRFPRWTDVLIPLLVLGLVAALRREAGYGRMAVSIAPLFLIPAFWVSLYGTRVDLAILLTAITVVRFVPNAALGFEPGEVGYGLAALMTSVIVCVLTQQTVRNAILAERGTRMLLEVLPVGFVVNRGGTIRYANSALARILGHSSPAEIEGRDALSMIHPESRAEVLRRIAKVTAGEPVPSADIRFLRAGEGEVLLESNPVRVPFEGASSIAIVLRDVSELRRMEREQRLLAKVGAVLAAATFDVEETLAQIARLVVSELVDCCVVDLVEQEGRPRRLVVAHRDADKTAACRRLEETSVEIPIPTRDVIDTKRPLVIRDISAALLGSVAQSEDHRAALLALGPRSSMMVPLVARGRVVGAMALLSTSGPVDYDERDLAIAQELALRVSLGVDNARLYEEARRATEARDQVLGIVAHDLRSPVTVMKLNAEMVAELAPQLGAGRKSIEAILRSATRANRLIQDLLDITRCEAGNPISIEPKALPAAQLAYDAVEAHRALASSAEVQLELAAPPELPACLGDRDRLLQVFENLIGNALKFTPRGGRITVGAKPAERDIRFFVEDTGAGMPAEELRHVFERFWQAKTGKRAGVGLGLPIVKFIVEAHGGKIGVDSVVGRGTTFHFTIPTVS